MKNVKIKIALLSTVLILFVSFKFHQTTNDKNKVILELIMSGLEQMHFKVHKVNNDFSENVFKLYLQRLDYSKRFFLQSDIDEFEKYKYKIDDEIKETDFTFFELSKNVYLKRIKEIKKYYTVALKKPYNFNKKEEIELDPKKTKYLKSKKELKKFWRKLLKYQVLEKLNTKIQIQDDAIKRKDTSVKVKTFKELEKQCRKELLKTFDDWHHRLMRTNDKDLVSIYLNSIVSYYGPHTQYFPPKDKKNFDIAMSGKLEGIGATLSQPNAYIKVVKIVPGSACWKQGELEAGDLILKVAQADKPPVNVVDMRLDDAIQMIRGKKGTEVRLTVKKSDGTIKVIPIIRDVVVIEETYAKSAIIKDTIANKKIGYIYLPSFYADFKDVNGRRCSADVKKEVKKLKNEGVDGIIVDLRNNGGGSLSDVVDIVGLFIKNGPVVRVKTRYAQTRDLSDTDTTVLYSGPLALMVNEYSASASEIMAAAIQDYKRGVIVGSKHTFGKGTVQRFLPLDRMIRGNDDLKPLGSLKLTIQKFYRINGGATQLKGVKSDIVLPDASSELKIGEEDMDYPIEWDEITRASYHKNNSVADVKSIEQKSNNRTHADSAFIAISKYAKYMKEVREQTKVSLNLENYKKEQEKRKKLNKNFKESIKRVSNYKYLLSKTDSVAFFYDTIKMEKFNVWKKNLKKDIYINETVNVIKDMINN